MWTPDNSASRQTAEITQVILGRSRSPACAAPASGRGTLIVHAAVPPGIAVAGEPHASTIAVEPPAPARLRRETR